MIWQIESMFSKENPKSYQRARGKSVSFLSLTSTIQLRLKTRATHHLRMLTQDAKYNQLIFLVHAIAARHSKDFRPCIDVQNVAIRPNIFLRFNSFTRCDEVFELCTRTRHLLASSYSSQTCVAFTRCRLVDQSAHKYISLK